MDDDLKKSNNDRLLVDFGPTERRVAEWLERHIVRPAGRKSFEARGSVAKARGIK